MELLSPVNSTSTGRAIAVCVVGAPVEGALLIATMLLMGPWPV
jgi:hypothetical protein